MTRAHRILLGFVAASLCGSVSAVGQVPVDSGWMYQGRLTDNGAPANGPYDLRFTLYRNSAGTLQTGPVLNFPGVVVETGLFTTKLDFGSVFTGNKTWLKVEVSPPGAGAYLALPLQEVSRETATKDKMRVSALARLRMSGLRLSDIECSASMTQEVSSMCQCWRNQNRRWPAQGQPAT